jgi:hypothetical protein
VDNLRQAIAVPIVAWLAVLAGASGHPDWGVSLYFYPASIYAAMFFVAAVCWFFVDPRRVVYGLWFMLPRSRRELSEDRCRRPSESKGECHFDRSRASVGAGMEAGRSDGPSRPGTCIETERACRPGGARNAASAPTGFANIAPLTLRAMGQ